MIKNKQFQLVRKDKPMLKYKFSPYTGSSYALAYSKTNEQREKQKPFVLDKVRSKNIEYEQFGDSPIKSHSFETSY